MIYLLGILVFILFAFSVYMVYLIRQVLKEFAETKMELQARIGRMQVSLNEKTHMLYMERELRKSYEISTNKLNQKCSELERKLQQIEYESKRPAANINPSDDIPPTLARNL